LSTSVLPSDHIAPGTQSASGDDERAQRLDGVWLAWPHQLARAVHDLHRIRLPALSLAAILRAANLRVRRCKICHRLRQPGRTKWFAHAESEAPPKYGREHHLGRKPCDRSSFRF
jgi:hypothetical protein